MPRRVTLVALWAVFAVASVSVGFAAAGLVSDPFTDVGTTAEASGLAGPGNGPVTEPDAEPTDPSSGTTGSPTPTPTKTKKTPTPTARPSTSGTTRSAGPTKTPGTASSPTTVKRGISTRGGYVSATCRGGLVSVGAAPAVYWRVDSLTPGRVQTARVRLEPAEDANGERVEVTASCPGGTPAFTSEYQDGGGGGGDDSHGSGGSDDSSGPGDG